MKQNTVRSQVGPNISILLLVLQEDMPGLMTPDNAEKMLLRAEIIRLAEQEALHGEIQWIRASPGTLCCELPTRCSQLTYKKYISTGWMLM